MTSNSENIVVFTIGRMNPPTPGHMLLIEKLILRAASLGQSKIGIILSHSQDLPKNPFTCEEKRKLLLSGMIQALKEQMKLKASSYTPPISPESIDRIEPIIICMDDATPVEFGGHRIIKSLNALLATYKIPVNRAILIIGEDRANDYGWILESLEKRTQPIQAIVEALPRPPGAISATEIRGYAMNGDWSNFSAKMQSTGLSPDALRGVFDQLHEMLTAPAPVAKGKGKGKKGGNKRKSKKTKKCGGNRRARKTRKIYKRHR
jgi:nicotinic acid mononucleotide adenylyltransferase